MVAADRVVARIARQGTRTTLLLWSDEHVEVADGLPEPAEGWIRVADPARSGDSFVDPAAVTEAECYSYDGAEELVLTFGHRFYSFFPYGAMALLDTFAKANPDIVVRTDRKD